MGKLALLLTLCLAALPAQAKRVVSLMPSYTEIIFELGAGGELVGRSNFCNWPPAAGAVEEAGDYLRPNIEKVYSLKPDLVFTGDWAGPSTAKQLSSLGVKVVALPEERSAADILNTVRLIAGALDLKKEGERLVKKLSALTPAVPKGRATKVYI
jgi:iron complex transport system substrate-binding protein